MKKIPTVGDTVLFYPGPSETECLANALAVGEAIPALVVRDWGGGLFNLTVFPDTGAPVSKTSVSQRINFGDVYVWDFKEEL